MNEPITLHLVLTHHWFNEMESGRKAIEYRAKSDRWRKMIWEKRERITHVRFSFGYSTWTITLPVTLIDSGHCPIPGWDGEFYRIHFTPNK